MTNSVDVSLPVVLLYSSREEMSCYHHGRYKDEDATRKIIARGMSS